MFKAFKDKLKGVLSKFSKKAEQEAQEQVESVAPVEKTKPAEPEHIGADESRVFRESGVGESADKKDIPEEKAKKPKVKKAKSKEPKAKSEAGKEAILAVEPNLEPKVEKKIEPEEMGQVEKNGVSSEKSELATDPGKKTQATPESKLSPNAEKVEAKDGEELKQKVPTPAPDTKEQKRSEERKLPGRPEPAKTIEQEPAKPAEKKGMFGWFKKKEPGAENAPEIEAQQPVASKSQEPKKPDEVGLPKKETLIQTPQTPATSEKPEIPEKPDKPEEKKGFFKRITQTITTKRLSEAQFEELFWDLEIALLENNVAVEVVQKIKDDLKKDLVDTPVPRGKIEETVISSLRSSIEGLFMIPPIDVVTKAKEKKPYVICFVGINGSGKTTSIAKVARFLQKQGLSVVLAAADTFRAAAIDQLQTHADRLDVKLIKHDYGSDPAAVAFDAIGHAKALKKDVVLIDTAGRLHSNVNLMDEMKKIIRVANPDLKLFVGESITGNDCVEQAQHFDDAIGIDGIILSKADIDEKGGAAISVSYVTKKPIVFLGVGQEYEDLEFFSKDKLIASIGI